MPNYIVTLTCNGGHRQRVEMYDYSAEMIEDWCRLMEGTSPSFVSSPLNDPNSRIGRCQTCKGAITATYVEIPQRCSRIYSKKGNKASDNSNI